MRDLASDEKTGANASLGLTYQHWYAALLAVERFGEMEDYLIILEFKEDVAIVDSPEKPTRAEFHQVKKNERAGIWTLAELLATEVKKSGDRSLSAMAKLTMRRLHFHPHPTVLWFASNVGFKLPLEEGSSPRMTHDASMDDLCETGLAGLRANIAKQLEVDEATINLSDFRLIRTGLPLEDPHRFVAGALSELADRRMLPFEVKRPVLSARMLANEFAQVGSKNSYAKTFNQLKKRGVSRRQVVDILVQVESFKQDSSHDILRECLSRLDREVHDYETLEDIKSETVRVCADLTDRTNVELRAVCVALSNARNSLKLADKRFRRLGENMEEIVYTAEKAQPELCGSYTLGYLHCLALLVIKNATDILIFAAAPGAQQEAKE
jgi:Cap4 dsDNA endonuclease